MHWIDILRLSCRQLLRTGKRSFLTILSVTIGVLSVILIASCGSYAASAVSKELRSLGIDGLLIYRAADDNANDAALPETLGTELCDTIPAIELAVPMNASVGHCVLRGQQNTIAIVGAGHGIQEALHLELLAGRFPTETEVNHGQKLAVIDSTLALKTYGRTNVVGKTMTISNGDYLSEYEICGIITSQTEGLSVVLGDNTPNMVYIPYTTQEGGEGKSAQLAVRCHADSSVEETADAVKVLLERTHHTEHYTVENICSYIERAETVAEIISLFASAVGGIALLVAGVGVMNSLLASAELRKRETGVYLALGARTGDILSGYLCEAVLMSVIGALSGILISCGILGVLHIPVDWSGCGKALGVTVLCGLLFGLTPAIRAAGMQPTDAMREC